MRRVERGGVVSSEAFAYWQNLQRASRYINLTVTNTRLSKRVKEKKGGKQESKRTEGAKGQKAERRKGGEV